MSFFQLSAVICPSFFTYFSAVSGHLSYFLYVLLNCQWTFVLFSLRTLQLSVVICPTLFMYFSAVWLIVLLSLLTLPLSVVICPTFFTYFSAVSGHLSYFLYILFSFQWSFVLLLDVLFSCQWSFDLLSLRILFSCQWLFVLLSLRTFQLSVVICPTFFTYSSTASGHLSYFLYVLFKCRQYTMPIFANKRMQINLT